MGRKKIEQSEKKRKLSVTISEENYDKIIESGITNKSKLIAWLLEEHFNSLNNDR